MALKSIFDLFYFFLSNVYLYRNSMDVFYVKLLLINDVKIRFYSQTGIRYAAKICDANPNKTKI